MIIINTKDSKIETKRMRLETSFINNDKTGELEAIRVRTLEIMFVDGSEIHRKPGPEIILSPEQIAVMLPGFGNIQNSFNSALDKMLQLM